MVAVPALIPETSPEFIVAIELLEEDQLPPIEVDEKVALSPTHIAWFPDKVPATGGAVTVMVLVAVALGQPPLPKTV